MDNSVCESDVDRRGFCFDAGAAAAIGRLTKKKKKP